MIVRFSQCNRRAQCFYDMLGFCLRSDSGKNAARGALQWSGASNWSAAVCEIYVDRFISSITLLCFRLTSTTFIPFKTKATSSSTTPPRQYPAFVCTQLLYFLPSLTHFFCLQQTTYSVIAEDVTGSMMGSFRASDESR